MAGRNPGSNKPPLSKEWWELGRAIQDLRIGKGITQITLCSDLPFNHPRLSNIENGQARSKAIEVQAIAKALGVQENTFQSYWTAASRAAATAESAVEPPEGWDERARYFQYHKLDRLFTDITYQLGPNRIPILWHEVLIFKPRTSGLRSVVYRYIYTGDLGCEHLEVVQGGRALGVSRLTTANFHEWDVELDRVPDPVLDESLLLEAKVTFDKCLDPPRSFFGCAPINTPFESCGQVVLRLVFDPNAMPAAIWETEALRDSMEVPIGKKQLTVPETGYLERKFSSAQPEVAYGWKWTWPDELSDSG